MARNNPGAGKKTESVYIGKERYAICEEVARRISFLTNYSVKTSWIIHYIIDNQLPKVEEEMIERLKKMLRTDGDNAGGDDA